MPPEYSEYQRIPMQHILFNVAQDPTYPREKQHHGLKIGCWIKDETRRNALYIARGWLEDDGWVPLSVIEHHLMTTEGDLADPEHKYIFNEAFKNGEAFVFYPVSKDATN